MESHTKSFDIDQANEIQLKINKRSPFRFVNQTLTQLYQVFGKTIETKDNRWKLYIYQYQKKTRVIIHNNFCILKLRIFPFKKSLTKQMITRQYGS